MRKKSLFAVLLVCGMCLCACGDQQSSVNSGSVEEIPVENAEGKLQETEQSSEEDYQGEQNKSEQMTQVEESDDLALEETENPLTSEQESLLYEYVNIAYWLEFYAEDPNYYKSKRKRSEELGVYYQKLLDLEPVDDIPKDIAESFMKGTAYQGKFDRQGLLDRFTILENVGISQNMIVTQHSGDSTTKSQLSWNYSEDGKICWENAFNNDHLYYNALTDYDIQREYDEDGHLVKTLYYDHGKLEYTVVHTYDANGHLIHEKRFVPGNEDNGMEYDITCDDQGRVVLAHWQDFWDNTLTYEYDDAGHLIKAEKVQSYDGENHTSVEYQYDANGMLDTGVVTYWTTGFSNKDQTKQENTIDYVCDDQGRVISSTTTVGHAYYTSGDQAGSVAQEQKNATVTIETIYGNYYFFK